MASRWPIENRRSVPGPYARRRTSTALAGTVHDDGAERSSSLRAGMPDRL
jgi:hypothetical protein